VCSVLTCFLSYADSNKTIKILYFKEFVLPSAEDGNLAVYLGLWIELIVQRMSRTDYPLAAYLLNPSFEEQLFQCNTLMERQFAGFVELKNSELLSFIHRCSPSIEVRASEKVYINGAHMFGTTKLNSLIGGCQGPALV